jgi:hypothetical protein
MTTKICTKCQKELPATAEFFHRGVGKYGFRAACKKCLSHYFSRHYQKNRKKKLEHKCRYYIENQTTILEKERQYWEENKSWLNKNRRERYKKDKKKIYEMKKKTIENNLNYRIGKNLRTRLWQALKNNQKKGSAVRDLGCSIEYLRSYLEAKFEKDMSWDNYGEWHMDHIMPLAHFDLTDRKQLLKACHYTNLQPLWAGENMSKKAKMGV